MQQRDVTFGLGNCQQSQILENGFKLYDSHSIVHFILSIFKRVNKRKKSLDHNETCNCQSSAQFPLISTNKIHAAIELDT